MRGVALTVAVGLALALAGCGGTQAARSASEGAMQGESGQRSLVRETVPQQSESQDPGMVGGEGEETEGEESIMRLSIDGSDVGVEWEKNQATAELADLVANGPITIQLSMYGGFEQVGPLGTTLTSEDAQTTTEAGDIVLYSGNQIVVFYGSNSWAYTKLGHITDQSAEDMARLLGNGDVSITISAG